jgi:hypothetical protein
MAPDRSWMMWRAWFHRATSAPIAICWTLELPVEKVSSQSCRRFFHWPFTQ